MNITAIIQAFDDFLGRQHQDFEGIIVGGAALNLLSITSRVTRDVDVMVPDSLPHQIAECAREFALQNNLPADWLNTGPADIVRYLPKNWQKRTQEIFKGKHLHLKTLGKKELLMTKCWAYCDRERDLNDILAMNPDKKDLEEITEWLKPLDANPDWPCFVETLMQEIINKLINNQN
ncbi:MAG: hypothetical protein H6618_04420 [Deltaproteobacteria bacterium]|nr:hypothetical protein [Deltaproteobacteria bacterium]